MTVRPDRDILIVVDQQVDFEPGGALPVPEGDGIIDSINLFASRFSESVVTQDYHPAGHVSFASSYRNRDPFTSVSIEEVDRGEVILSDRATFSLDDLGRYLQATVDRRQTLWPDHCLRGSTGAAIDPRLDLSCTTIVLRKGGRSNSDSYSAFRENDGRSTGLAEALMARGIERIFVVGLAGDYCVLATALDGVDAGFEVVYVSDLTRYIGDPEGARDRARHAGVIVVEHAAI